MEEKKQKAVGHRSAAETGQLFRNIGEGFDDAFDVRKGLSPITDDSDIATYIENHDAEFGLYTSTAIMDVSVGYMVIEASDGTATLSVQLEESDDLGNWTDAGPPEIWIWPMDADKKFIRIHWSE